MIRRVLVRVLSVLNYTLHTTNAAGTLTYNCFLRLGSYTLFIDVIDHTVSVSPARKRQRLSSPTYEDQFGDLTQEDLAAFDEIEARISQGELFPSSRKADPGQHGLLASPEPQSPSAQGEPTSSFTIPSTDKETLPDDSDNPFSVGFSFASKMAVPEPKTMGFTTAAGLPSGRNFNRSPSPEVPPVDHNYDDWFKPAPPDVSTDFGMTSFTTASSIKGLVKTPFIMPSEASLAKAKARLAAWDMEDSILEGKLDVPANSSSPSKHIQNTSFKKASYLKEKRPVLTTLPNALNAPDTPLSAISTPAAVIGPPTMKISSLLPPRQSAFKSPLQTTKISNLPSSPLNPGLAASSTSGIRHPLSGTPVTAARLMQNTTDADITASSFNTPLRLNSSSRNRPAKFLTPFKSNMRPGELGRQALPRSRNPSSSVPPKDVSSAVAHTPSGGRITRKQFFALSECIHYSLIHMLKEIAQLPRLEEKP
jgi:breast cancer 2 susceptibility protein